MPPLPIVRLAVDWLRTSLWRRLARSSRDVAGGQALVEFALGLPLMLLIMLGTLDIGQMFIDYVTMRNGVREAASYAARNPDDDGGIRRRYTEHSLILTDDGDDIYSVVCLDRGGGTIGCDGLDPAQVDGVRIELTASRVYEPVMTGFLQDYFGIPPFVLEARATAEVLK